MATGTSLSSTSNLSVGQKIMYNAARIAFEPAAPDPDLVEVHRMPKGHFRWDVLWWARLAQAEALTEGVDYGTYQQLVANSTQITPTEHGVMAIISKRLQRRQGDANVMAVTGTLLANGLRRRMANDIIALYDGFSKSTPGASLGIDVTTFRGANAYLMTDNESAYGPAPMPLRAALHIQQISDIVLDVTDPGTRVTPYESGWGAEMVRAWWRGSDRLYGTQLFHSGNITRDASDDAKGAIFAKSALALVIAEEADTVQERDISLRAAEVGIFQEWSESEVVDPFGVEIYSDAASTI